MLEQTPTELPISTPFPELSALQRGEVDAVTMNHKGIPLQLSLYSHTLGNLEYKLFGLRATREDGATQPVGIFDLQVNGETAKANIARFFDFVPPNLRELTTDLHRFIYGRNLELFPHAFKVNSTFKNSGFGQLLLAASQVVLEEAGVKTLQFIADLTVRRVGEDSRDDGQQSPPFHSLTSFYTRHNPSGQITSYSNNFAPTKMSYETIVPVAISTYQSVLLKYALGQ